MWNDFQKFTNELIQKNYKFYINNATDFVLCLNDTTTKNMKNNETTSVLTFLTLQSIQTIQ